MAPITATLLRTPGIALRAIADAVVPFVCALALCVLVGAGTAGARDLTEAESASLAQTVSGFDAAMRASDYAGVVKIMPPRILEHIAKGAGVEVDVLRKIVIEQMGKALAAVKLVSFGMDIAKAEHRELADGTPYVLIPTEVVMDAGEGKTVARAHTLALIDADVWYLLRVSDQQQLTILRQVYPEYAGVEFPSGSVEALKE
jgi:hypothetical protein